MPILFVISMFCQTMTIALQAPNDSNETKPQLEFGYVMMNSYVPQEVAVDTIPAVCEGIGLRYEDLCSGFAVELTKESDGHPGEKSVVRIFPLTKDRGGRTFSEGPVWVNRNGQQHRVRASVSILNEVSVSPGFLNFETQDPESRNVASVEITGPVGLNLAVPAAIKTDGLTVLVEAIESTEQAVFKVTANWDSSRSHFVKETIRLRCEGLRDPAITKLPLYVEGATGPRVTNPSHRKPLIRTNGDHHKNLMMLLRVRGTQKVVKTQSQRFADEWSPRMLQTKQSLLIQESNLPLPSAAVSEAPLTDTLTFTFSDGWTEKLKIEYQLVNNDARSTP